MKFTSSRRSASLHNLLTLVMGERGAGKTEAGATCPGPVILSTREGTAALDVENQGDIPDLATWRDAVATLLKGAERAKEKGVESPWRTVVVDELGDLNDMCVQATLSENGVPYLGHPKDENKAMYKQSRLRLVDEVIRPLRTLRDAGYFVVVLVGEKSHPGRKGTPEPDRVGLEMSGSTEKEVRSYFDLVLRIENVDSGKVTSKRTAEESRDNRRVLRFKPITRDGMRIACKARDPKGGNGWPDMAFITDENGDSTFYPTLSAAFDQAYKDRA